MRIIIEAGALPCVPDHLTPKPVLPEAAAPTVRCRNDGRAPFGEEVDSFVPTAFGARIAKRAVTLLCRKAGDWDRQLFRIFGVPKERARYRTIVIEGGEADPNRAQTDACSSQ